MERPHLLKKLTICATLATAGLVLAAPPQPVFAAKKKTTQKKSPKKAKKPMKKKSAQKKGTTKYNFRARTYYPWYEGYDGLESFYMQFDREFGF